MIRYYAYYNHGGYKDFYLGTQQEHNDKYFLPLLVVHEQSLCESHDAELKAKVEHQRNLPKIIQLSDVSTEYDYPQGAKIMMSHGGYKALFRILSSKTAVLCVRDIEGAKDVYGRNTPFNIMLIGDAIEDLQAMDSIAEFVRLHLSDFEKFMASIFESDLTECGLKCHLGMLNDYVTKIMDEGLVYDIDEALNKSARMIVIHSVSNLANTLREQSLDKQSIYAIYDTCGNLLYKAKPQVPEKTVNVTTKQVDAEKIWSYMHSLEQRIEILENEIKYLRR